MAPKKANWDVQRDHMLFMLLVDHINVNWNDIARKWADKYPNDESKPSGSAIAQHILKLKKGSGPNNGPGAASKSTPVKNTPSTKRAAPPKTPSSSAKRARTSRMSDEDDSDDEKTMSFAAIGKRETSRRSSGPRKSYREDSEEEEGGGGGAVGVNASDNIDVAATATAPRDSVQADDIDDLFGGPRKETKACSKGNPREVDHFTGAAESDEDTFVPMV